MVRLYFPSSNNVVEYEALINGLRIANELGILQRCIPIEQGKAVAERYHGGVFVIELTNL